MLSLLTTKLLTPQLLPSTLTRDRLLQRLDKGSIGKLILVSAPAGSGKSTLIASWLQETGRLTAWLSLDPTDNDPERFFSYLISALQRFEPAFGLELQAIMQAQSAVQIELLMNRLLGELTGYRQDLLLVLDDYHVITNRTIHEAVNYLLDHLPRQLCLVITSRVDPDLALSRLRVRGQLTELRADDLRFDLPETDAFLNEQLGLELSQADIVSLEGRTEGWAAGLQLAALSLQGRSDKAAFIATFAGSHRFLVEYLMSEVLAMQTELVRKFLKETSVLERLSASLCETVTGQPTSQALLEEMTAANLFVIPLDDTQSWFRYHHLFAEFLRHDLYKTDAELVPELHRRASSWFEKEGWTNEAFEHALLAGDVEKAALLVEDVAFDLTARWNNAQLINYVQRVPLASLHRFPQLCMHYSWALANTGQLRALAEFMPHLEVSANHTQYPNAVAAIVLTLRSYEHLRQREFQKAIELARQALALMEPALRAHAISREEQAGILFAFNNVAYNCLHSDPQRAEQLYPESIALCLKYGIWAAVINGHARLGRVKRQLGQLHGALDTYKRGFAILAQQRQDERSSWIINTGELHLGLAGLLYERNRIDEAEAFVSEAKVLNELSRFPPALGLELETLFQLYLARGEVEAAQTVLEKLRHLVTEVDPDNRFFRELVEVMTMDCTLSLADWTLDRSLLIEVENWVKSRNLGTEDTFDYSREAPYRILARLLLAQSRQDEAISLLGRLVKAAREQGRKDDLVRYLLLQALVAQTSGDQRMVTETLHEALSFAEPEEYCRSFVDLGDPMRLALQAFSEQHPTRYLTKLLQAFPTQDSPESDTPQHMTTVIVPRLSGISDMTDRERRILQLIASGNTNKAIAKELGLSPNTVRWYVSGLLGKLQVRTRMEAANRARELDLV